MEQNGGLAGWGEARDLKEGTASRFFRARRLVRKVGTQGRAGAGEQKKGRTVSLEDRALGPLVDQGIVLDGDKLEAARKARRLESA